jgi:S1-C subfamily serine protease
MSYDEFWDEKPRRSLAAAGVIAVAAVLLAGVAVAIAGYVLYAQHSRVESERAAQKAEVARLQARVDKLAGRDKSLSGRIKNAEKRLSRREVGIAPLAARVLKSVFTVETMNSLGSGFVAWQDDDGSYLITANHVVADTYSGSVTISRKGGSWQGDVLKKDPKNDLALIRINGHPPGAEALWQFPSRAASPHEGDELVLIGSPFGLGGTVTSGIVSRVTKRVIQTDAAANPGNSGGPAIDRTGRMVGVLVAGGGQNVNFAIPIRRACVKLRACRA